MATEDAQMERDADIERVDVEIDEISKRILLELESASAKDLSDTQYARMMLRLSEVNYAKRVIEQMGSITKHSTGVEANIEKRAVIKVLLFSTWLQRLYFIIRAFLMGRIGGIILFGIIWYIGSIDLYGMLVVDTFLFIFTLVITRLFDNQIVKLTKKIVGLLANHRVARDFIMNHF